MMNPHKNILNDKSSKPLPISLYTTLSQLKKFIDEYIGDNQHDIYLEGDLKCFEDINFLIQDEKWDEYYVFIQVKGWKISRKEFFKMMNNFYENINFQENYENKNYKFVLLSQYSLNNSLKKKFMKINTEDYLDFVLENYFSHKKIESIKVEDRKKISKKILEEKSFKNIKFRKKSILLDYYKKFKYVFNNLINFENINLFEIEEKLASFFWNDFKELSAELNSVINKATSKWYKNNHEKDKYNKYKKVYFKCSKNIWVKLKHIDPNEIEWSFIM